MAQFFHIHPETPQLRLIRRAVDIVRDRGLIVYPTDSSYAIGCAIGDKNAMERICAIRRLEEQHNFTLVCRNLADITTYARIDKSDYRLLRAFTPGAYTFIYQATKQVPKRLQNSKRKTIGIRIPDNVIAQALLAELNEPLLSTTLQLPGDDFPLTDPHEIFAVLDYAVDLVIDGGLCGLQATTVIDMSGDVPQILRVGKGDPSHFGHLPAEK